MVPLRPAVSFCNACPTPLRLSALGATAKQQSQPNLRSSLHIPTHTPPATQRFHPLKLLRSCSNQHRRQKSTYDSARHLFRSNPYSTTLASVTILFGMLGLVFVNHYYSTQIIEPYLGFPDAVAKKLRRAIYYTNIDLQPKQALKYFKQALHEARESGMDPYGKGVVGVKVELSRMLELANAHGSAIEVLESLRQDCNDWLAGDVRQRFKAPQKDEEGRALTEEEKEATMRERRAFMLMTAVRANCKLGDLYASPGIGDRARAEERLLWGVTALMKEQKRREDEGVKRGEGEWFGNDEVGAALESLADHYASQNLHYLATPLYLQSLSFNPNTCHTVTLMTNLATSLTLQNPPSSSSPSTPAASQTNQLDAATQWAQKALKLGQSIQPPERTRECDEGRAVATINLGEFAAMEGSFADAKRYWEEGRAVAKAIGMGQGIKMAEEGLKELKGKE